jgi:hypothetical protein
LTRRQRQLARAQTYAQACAHHGCPPLSSRACSRGCGVETFGGCTLSRFPRPLPSALPTSHTAHTNGTMRARELSHTHAILTGGARLQARWSRSTHLGSTLGLKHLDVAFMHLSAAFCWHSAHSENGAAAVALQQHRSTAAQQNACMQSGPAAVGRSQAQGKEGIMW